MKWMINGVFKALTDDEYKALSGEDTALYLADKQKSDIDEAVKAALKGFEDKIEEAKKGNVSVEDYKKLENSMKDTLSKLSLTEDDKNEIHKKHADLLDTLKTQGKDITFMKSSSANLKDNEKKSFEHMSRKNQFKLLLEKGMETTEFKEWADSDMKGATAKMDIAKVTGLASDHTGPIFVTEPVNNVRDIPRTQPHMRDYISVGATEETSITYPEITDYNDVYTLGAQMLAENEEVTDVSFKSKENTSQVARLGVSLNVSKRYFRGRSRVIIDHILAQIPDALMFKEDVQVLKGDGSGNNLNGITTDARKFNLTPKTYVATNFASVATWNGGTQSLITFAVAHGLLGGDTLTIANATEATYNATHKEILIVDEKTLIINLTYVAEANTSAWTGTGTSYWFEKFATNTAQEFDVLSAAISILEAGLYRANVIFLNPQTVMGIATLKATDLQYVGVTRDAAGNLNVNGVPIVSIPVIDAGWYLLGDFSAKNIEIRDYSTMTIQFLSDVTTEKKNAIVVLADEEIHLVKYNPKWYIYDRFSTSIAQIEA